MASRGYSWKNVRQGSTFSLPKTDHLWRLIILAVVLALLAHLVVILGLKKMQISIPALRILSEVTTDQIIVTDVEFRESLPEIPENELQQAPEVVGKLLDEIEILDIIPENTEIDISPVIEEMQFDVEMIVPAAKGEISADSSAPIDSEDLIKDMPILGKVEDIFQTAAVGQIVIDPGAQMDDAFDADEFNEKLAKMGEGGLADTGVLDSYTALSAMTTMSGNALQNSKGMIGSDLLFEFNESLLKESARNSLLKVALLIDKNPDLYCWIEGHTDTIGGDEANGELSVSRATAVKQWLVRSMRIDPERLIVIGHGERQPIIKDGDKNQQAINRRVVIKMRKEKPNENNAVFLEQSEKREEPPAKAILIKPTGPPIIPTAERVDTPPMSDSINQVPAGRALLVDENEAKAIPVQPRRAIPVE